MSVEVLSHEAMASEAVRRNINALVDVIQRWDERFGLNHETKLTVVRRVEGSGDELGTALHVNDHDGLYSEVTLSALGISGWSDDDIQRAAAELVVASILVSLTSERDPAPNVTDHELIDCTAMIIVKGFLGR